MPFKIVPDRGDKPMIEIDCNDKAMRYAPEEVSAMVLQKMKTTAEAFLGEAVESAVVTVPAYFNDARELTFSLLNNGFGLIAGDDSALSF